MWGTLVTSLTEQESRLVPISWTLACCPLLMQLDKVPVKATTMHFMLFLLVCFASLKQGLFLAQADLELTM